jgi:hypothetical protein
VGGKSHEFVVGLLGVLPGAEGVANDGVLIDARQAGGLTDATTVLEVLEDGHGLLVFQAGAEEGTALALREALLAGAADQHPALFERAIAEADAEVVVTTQPVVGAVGVLAAKQTQVVHGRHLVPAAWVVDNACQVL